MQAAPTKRPSSSFHPQHYKASNRTDKTHFLCRPDGISYRNLEQLGPVAVGALTDIFNISIQQKIIPNIWKLGKIVPNLKPSESPREPSSYRPTSLLCNPLKILERLVLNHIAADIPISTTQHGFRAKHCATKLLTTLTQHIHESLKAPKPAHHT